MLRNSACISNWKDRKWEAAKKIYRLLFLGSRFWDGDVPEGSLLGSVFIMHTRGGSEGTRSGAEWEVETQCSHSMGLSWALEQGWPFREWRSKGYFAKLNYIETHFKKKGEGLLQNSKVFRLGIIDPSSLNIVNCPVFHFEIRLWL